MTNVNFVNNIATGGAGGAATRGSTGNSGGGGGGLGGGGGTAVDGGGGGGGYSGGGGGAGGYGGVAGGAAGAGPGGAGGTGGIGNGATGSAGTGGGAGGIGASNAGGGGGGGGIGGGPGGAAASGAGAGGGGGGGLVAGSGGTGGASAAVTAGGAGGLGGGGGGARYSGGAGGAGGDFGGGGGGSSNSQGGAGGFGGGGGGSGTGGAGGFGGGGGGSTTTTAVAGGTGGGTGAASPNGGGGGGAAFGGAVFVRAGAGLVVTTGIANTGFSGSNVIAGVGGGTAGTGRAAGSDLFLQTGAATTFAPATGTRLALAGTIADDSAASVPAVQTYRAGTAPGGALTIGVGTSGGTVILSGANTYNGATTINAGTLEVDGSIVSTSTVNNGGVQSGTGTLAVSMINAGGTLAPGSIANPFGTLAVAGLLTFQQGSFYNVAITPTQNSRTNVTGTAAINGGTVQVLAGNGTYQARQYTILNATTARTGQFANVTSNLAFLVPTLAYDLNNAFLNITIATPTAGGTIDYRNAAATQNQRAVAGGLTNAGIQNGGTGSILTAFNQLTVPQAQTAFDSISGEGITGAQNVAYRSSSLFVSSITDQTTFYGSGAANSVTLTDARPNPLAYVATRTPNSPIVTRDPVVPASRTWRAWTTGFGAGENIRGDAGVGTAAQANSVYGGTLGVDYQFAGNYLAGVALGGTDGSFSVPGRNTFGSTTGGHAAFYSLANFGAFYGAGTTSVSFFGNRTTRNIAGFGGLAGETERGNFASREFRSRAEFGWHTGVYGATLTPFVALEIAQLRSNGFTEGALNGAGLLALNVQGQTGASVPGYVGARLSRAFLLDNGMVFTPTIQAAYLHEFAPQRTLTAGLVNLPGSTFLVDGVRASSNAAQVKAGAELTLTANVRAFATFDGEFSGVEQVYAGKGGLRYTW